MGCGKALKYFREQLTRPESCNGWQLITITTYDKTNGMPNMRWCKDLQFLGPLTSWVLKLQLIF